MRTYVIAFLINWLVNILIIEFFAIRKLKPLIKVDEARDSQYPAYRRNDVFWFNRAWLYLMCPLMLIRIFAAFFTAFICAIICNLAVMGLRKEDSIRGWRYAVIRVTQFVGCLIVLASCGIIWYSKNRPTVCYKKYLGPDWVADYNWRHQCGCVISNHSSLLDTFVHSLQQISSFVAKVEVTYDFSLG